MEPTLLEVVELFFYPVIFFLGYWAGMRGSAKLKLKSDWDPISTRVMRIKKKLVEHEKQQTKK